MLWSLLTSVHKWNTLTVFLVSSHIDDTKKTLHRKYNYELKSNGYYSAELCHEQPQKCHIRNLINSFSMLTELQNPPSELATKSESKSA